MILLDTRLPLSLALVEPVRLDQLIPNPVYVAPLDGGHLQDEDVHALAFDVDDDAAGGDGAALGHEQAEEHLLRLLARLLGAQLHVVAVLGLLAQLALGQLAERGALDGGVEQPERSD